MAGFRDDAGKERDQDAEARDELAEDRDQDAEARDKEASELDVSEGHFDKHTLRVQELRGRAAAARRRAANARAEARRDREQAARDRELAAQDREQAASERRLAGTDELTGARRRGVGLEEVQREMDRARRTGGSLVAVFVDVDDLKSVNDGLGHAAGDELLCELVQTLRRHVRSYDLVVRLGGDEFLCALPNVSLEDARRRFDDLNAELRDGPESRSVSFGVCELQDGEEVKDLIDHADRDLLAARAS